MSPQNDQPGDSARDALPTPLTDALDTFTRAEYTAKVYALMERARDMERKLNAALAELAKAEQDQAKYHFLVNLFMHQKWADAGALLPLRPPDQKYIDASNLDDAIDTAIRASDK
jgi:hypothetical protein